MKKYAILSALALLTSLASNSYANLYQQQSAPIAQNYNPNLYERNRSATGGAQQNNPGGYRSSYYYQDNYYRYNSNPTDVYPDYNAATPNPNNRNANWNNVNSPYRGDYQGSYEYR